MSLDPAGSHGDQRWDLGGTGTSRPSAGQTDGEEEEEQRAPPVKGSRGEHGL